MTTMIDHRIARHCHPNTAATQTPRILCVDDDPDFQTTIELRMRKYDVHIEHAFYGMQGIVEAVRVAPDVILMDHAMPHGDGEYLLDVVRRNPVTSKIPVVVLTGMRDPKLKTRLIRSGADGFLQKPVHLDDLVHQLRRFVDLREREGNGGVE